MGQLVDGWNIREKKDTGKREEQHRDVANTEHKAETEMDEQVWSRI